MRDGETRPRRPCERALRLRMAFVLDVAGYGARGVLQQQQVQRRLRRLVDATLDGCGLKLDPEVVEHQWTGDGINAVLPADIDPTVILPLLIRSLASALGADNAQSADRIRLRMAVSAGLIEAERGRLQRAADHRHQPAGRQLGAARGAGRRPRRRPRGRDL